MMRSTERGVALIWAIIIMLVVLGVLALVTASTMSTTREAKDSASRTRAVFWAQAAGKDLVSRLKSAELGSWVQTVRPNGDLVLTFGPSGTPQGLAMPTKATFPNGTGATATRALPLVGSSGSGRGWYQVLPPAHGVSPWTGIRVRDPANPGGQGSVQFVVRAWDDVTGAAPVLVRLELRRNALSRFAVLSEDHLALGGIGTLQLGGRVHTNNTRNAATAIQIGAATDISGAQSITSASGTIAGCASTTCRADIGERVSFGSAARAMEQVARLSQQTTPFQRCNDPAGFVACRLTLAATTLPNNVMPLFTVNLAGTGGCVNVGRTTAPLRSDTGGVPSINDRVGPSSTTTPLGTYCPARGGGALLLEGDVLVSGRRALGTAAVTVMARRPSTFPSVLVNGVATTVTLPASIYLLQSGGIGIGTVDPDEPVGLVAQGGVYLPSWAMNTTNSTLSVTNVATMAVSGEIAYSPSIQAIAADGSTPGGMGISPATARSLGYGFGQSFTYSGSLLSGGRMSFRYGQAATYIGYGARSISYVPSLTWNSPPHFPADAEWHLADWTEFDE